MATTKSQMNVIFVFLSLVLFGCSGSVNAQQLSYPDSERLDHYDDYHGISVHDPYRWLEEDVRTSASVAAWVEAQNAVADAYLREIRERDPIRARVTELWNNARYSVPERIAGGKYYVYSRNDGLQNQSVVYVTEQPGTAGRVLLDPNEWSEDGTVALQDISFSYDGSYVAYGVSEAGSDWKRYRVRHVESGKDLSDEIRWVKFSNAEWTPDGKGFFYGRYDAPDASAFVNVNQYHKLYYHRLGTSQDDDVLVYHRPDEPEWGFRAVSVHS